jgi:riboflavin biosynthesis pyrimidine reductase
MVDSILRLYPGPSGEVPLKGCYLAERVNELGSPKNPFVYANFVSSLDGRIAVEDTVNGLSHVPSELTSAHDFRLFLELQAQADCLITHGGYLRAIAERRLDDILQVGTRPETRDLAEWRAAQGLAAQPAVVVASASLDFVIPDSVATHGQRVYIATGRTADAGRVADLERRGYPVIVAGEGKSVEGGALVQALGRLGFTTLYLLAGPLMLGTMLRQHMLSRLYVTVSHQLIAGEQFDTMVEGPRLGEAGRLNLSAVYYDPAATERPGQFFLSFEPAP